MTSTPSTKFFRIPFRRPSLPSGEGRGEGAIHRREIHPHPILLPEGEGTLRSGSVVEACGKTYLTEYVGSLPDSVSFPDPFFLFRLTPQVSLPRPKCAIIRVLPRIADPLVALIIIGKIRAAPGGSMSVCARTPFHYRIRRNRVQIGCHELTLSHCCNVLATAPTFASRGLASVLFPYIAVAHLNN